jgi:hypothetical protein
MARRSPPRKVTYFEPVAPRLARNTIIESTFDVGRRFRCLGGFGLIWLCVGIHGARFDLMQAFYFAVAAIGCVALLVFGSPI